MGSLFSCCFGRSTDDDDARNELVWAPLPAEQQAGHAQRRRGHGSLPVAPAFGEGALRQDEWAHDEFTQQRHRRHTAGGAAEAAAAAEGGWASEPAWLREQAALLAAEATSEEGGGSWFRRGRRHSSSSSPPRRPSGAVPGGAVPAFGQGALQKWH